MKESTKLKIAATAKIYKETHREQAHKYAAEYQIKNRELLSIKKKKYYKENKERLKIRNALHYQKNKSEYKKREQKYRDNNRVKVRKTKNHYYKKRVNSDPLFKFSKYLRSRVCDTFRKQKIRKNGKTEELLGVSFDLAKQHITKLFKKGMSWKNYGKWHVDHKIPLSSAKTEEEMELLCHYTNLQPLWAKENLEKSNKIIETQMKLTI